MSCFNFLNKRSFTGKLKPLGILVSIRKPEHGKKSYNYYILGLKLKKLDVLTSKKQSLSTRCLDFNTQTCSLHSSALLTTSFTIGWKFHTVFESQIALTFIIFNFCKVCCKVFVNRLSKALSDLLGLTSYLTEQRRD